MKNGDDSSDLDDLPLSSLGVKPVTNKQVKKKQDRVGDKTSPPSKKLKADNKKDVSKVKSDDKTRKKESVSTKRIEKSPSPKKKEKTSVKSTKKLKVKKKPKAEQVMKKRIKKKSSVKTSSKTETDEQMTSSVSTKALITASSELYSRCDKGKLIQNVLCRWWYAYTWPDPNDIPSKVPSGCDALDGFPGVYVVTSGPNVGEIKNFRNQDKVIVLLVVLISLLDF